MSVVPVHPYTPGADTDAETRGNARLIAAAPELLEALKEAEKLLAKIARRAREAGWDLTERRCREGVAAAAAAIRRAEGAA